MKGKQPAHLTSSGFNQCGKQTSNIVRTTRSVCLYKGSDNVPSSYGSTCDIIFVEFGMGVSVIPFGQSHVYDVDSASEGESFSFIGFSFNELSYRKSSTIYRRVSEDAQLYLDVTQKHSWCCKGNSRPGCSTRLEGCLDIRKRKLQTSDVADVFQAYSDLCSTNVRRRCSANFPQSSHALNFSLEEITDSDVFRRLLTENPVEHLGAIGVGSKGASDNATKLDTFKARGLLDVRD
nr:hypothetical protein [Tanacetum cinerariifolium]